MVSYTHTATSFKKGASDYLSPSLSEERCLFNLNGYVSVIYLANIRCVALSMVLKMLKK